MLMSPGPGFAEYFEFFPRNPPNFGGSEQASFS